MNLSLHVGILQPEHLLLAHINQHELAGDILAFVVVLGPESDVDYVGGDSPWSRARQATMTRS